MKERKHYQFVQNKACEYFPCHKGDEDTFNCLFCYCPLYALKEKCGGNFRYTDKGIKDCSQCTKPHDANGYEHVRAHLGALIEQTKK